MTPTLTPTPERIMQMGWGYTPVLIIQAALNHRLFDLVDEGPKTIAELAELTGASVRGLTILSNGLVGLQLFARAGDHYSLTPESAAFLVSGKPFYQGSLFTHTAAQLLPKWLHLTEIVRTGRPAMVVNQQAEGGAFFAGLVESIFPMSYPTAIALGQHLEISKTTTKLTVLDVGAGSGVWGIALAEQSPHVEVYAVDWPEVLEVTRRLAEQHGVGERVIPVPGGLEFVDFGTGRQIATLGHILHSEGPEKSRLLLRRTYEALAPGGTVAVIEFLPNDERTGPPHALLFAVSALVNTENGDTFTFAEIRSWLREAGFVNIRLLDISPVSPLILANRPA